jgi:hypothetical protein
VKKKLKMKTSLKKEGEEAGNDDEEMSKEGEDCYTLILDLKILVQFFFSCISSHLNCL